jgi:hypothetical protein
MMEEILVYRKTIFAVYQLVEITPQAMLEY